MNATKLFALTVLTAVVGAAFAGETGALRDREAVKAEVKRARLDGTLMPVGEAPSWPSVHDTPSTLARADVKAQVLQARLEGTLMPPGEGHGFVGRPIRTAPVALTQARIGR